MDVEVEGELVTTSGDATKGLRELVRRTTIGEASGRPSLTLSQAGEARRELDNGVDRRA